MKQRIIDELKRIEQSYGVKIVYAVESGSRAWGFPSQDSDYDVRFIYVPKKEWYFSIEQERDVIEEPIHDLLDISGWELRKTLRLFKKSNPPLLEWLSSDIVYYEAFTTAEQLRKLRTEAFKPEASVYHYINMARRNVKDYLQGQEVKIKKYFYVLRPILACQWIEKHGTIPPMDFTVLMNELVAEPELKAEMETLLERKRRGEELDLEARIDVIHQFIEMEIERIMEAAKELKAEKKDMTSELNRLLLNTVEEVWKDGGS
ncbi:nucleotidyltransferase domain-containing protein [Bacillus subtilis]|uniref:nucleotidyltransferase domain-containing protein n=1 Tax=Bacillus subtilis TaxID=1423 RepID=UPI0028682B6B|nr:nucleotidyltransferase domain-containing protein [Bacillus subtilis]WMW52745.1 nucleotidyltransferase domain-containing protein [Bacillus subtilis]